MPRAVTQDQVADRLHMEAKKMMRDRVELPATKIIGDAWIQTRDDIMAFARGVWDQEGAEDHPFLGEQAKARITEYMDRELKRFRDAAANALRVGKSQAYEQQTLADAWILDQVTPPNIKVRPQRDPTAYNSDTRAPREIGEAGVWARDVVLRESWFNEPAEGDAAVDPDTGEARAGTDQRLDGWLKSWEASVFGGLALSSVMGDGPTDVEGRIARATASGSEIDQVLSRMVSTEIQVAIADADDDFNADNRTLVQDRIWTTMEDERVCYLCRAEEGSKWTDRRFNIPRHPRCRCWWRTVPKSYKDLAGGLAVPGRGDRAMAIRDPQTGEEVGQVIVEFDGWAQQIAS